MELLEKASPADDDIIELTDIIEQGSAAAAAKTTAAEGIESQMDNLFSKGNKEDQHLVPDDMGADIDDLLLDMEADFDAPAEAATAPTSAGQAPSSPALNPDETLDMPNMSEVDALLEGLDIPPQPTGASAASGSAQSGLDPDSLSDDIDSMLGELLDGSTKAAPKAAAPAPLSNDAFPTDLPGDLDSLLAEATAEMDAAPKATPKSAPTADLGLDDLDSLLADSAPAPKAAPKAAPSVSPDDLDALLAEATAEMDAAPKAASKSAPTADLGLDDLDSLLADSAPAPKAAPTADLGLDDLDSLLDTPPTPTMAQEPVAEAPKSEPSFDDELESLLAAAAAPSPKGKAGMRAAADPPSLEEDLDALFAAVSPKAADAASAQSEATQSEAAQSKATAEPVPSKTAPSDAGHYGREQYETENEDDIPIDLSDLDDTDSSDMPEAEALADILTPTKKAKAAPTVDDMLGDITMSDAAPAEDFADMPAKTSAPAPASAEDFADMPASATPEAFAAPAPAEVPAPAKAKATASAEDFADMPAEVPAPASASSDTSQQTFAEINTLMAEVTDPQDLLTAAPVVDISMVSMSDLADMPDLPQSPKLEEDLPELDALDALLSAANKEAPGADNLADLELVADIELSDADETTEFTDEEIALVAQELYDEKVMAEASTGEVDTKAWLNSLDEVLEADEESPADESLPATDADMLQDDTDVLLGDTPMLTGNTDMLQDDTDVLLGDADEDKGLEALAAATLAAEALDIDALGAPLVDGTAPASAPDSVLDAADSASTVPTLPPHAESIDQLLAHLPEEPENTHYVYRPNSSLEGLGSSLASSNLAGTNHLNEPAPAGANQQFEKAYEQELARLQHITDRFAQSLAAADMHIAALTNTTTNAVPPIRVLDAILRQDSPFSTTLHTLVRDAVASELKSTAPTAADISAAAPHTTPLAEAMSAFTTGRPTPSAALLTETSPQPEGIAALHQRLDGLNAQMHDLQERINALEDGNKEARLQTVETRVDGQVKTIIHLEEQCKILEARLEAQAKSQSNLENRFQHEVEKAAAAAAAKIIREEIAGILAGN